MCIYIYIYICMSVCTYVRMCMCIFVYMYREKEREREREREKGRERGRERCLGWDVQGLGFRLGCVGLGLCVQKCTSEVHSLDPFYLPFFRRLRTGTLVSLFLAVLFTCEFESRCKGLPRNQNKNLPP